ncbi:MAG: hypothetical protein Q8L48_17235 [Archangium sp.]|nr:hypothetical protein [Archangium sp.]
MRLALIGLLFVGCSAAPVKTTARGPVGGLEIEPTSGLGLFADERAQGQVLLASALAARDAGIAPVELTRRAWALAAEGRNPLTGAACGKPLSSYQARQRWGAALGVTGSVGSNVWCEADGGCELNVYGRPLDDTAGERFKLVAPVPAGGPALEALAAALPQLAPPPPDEGGGLGAILGSLGGSSPIQEEDRLDVRVWPSDHRQRSTLDEPQRRQGFPALTVGQVQTCLSGADERIALLIEVNSAGTITRCEGDSSEDAATASCACGQLQKVAAAPWLAGLRWSVSLDVDRRDQTTSDRRFVLNGSWSTYIQRVQVPGDKYPRFKPKVEDPSIEAWNPGSARLATGCFTNAFAVAGSLNSRWAVWFDGVGRATKVVEQKGFPPLQKDLAECVARALRTAQSPCPSRAGLWAMADLRVAARDPNAPPASLKDLLK